MIEMKEKIKEVFEALQLLDIKPTPNNVSILNGVFAYLREIFKELEEQENAGTEGRNTPDISGRNND